MTTRQKTGLHLLALLLLCPALLYAAQFTVSKSLLGSSGSFNTAGITLPAFTYPMSGTIVAGFSAPIPSNVTALANGGITGKFCGSFLFVNTDTNVIVNLYGNSTGTQTQAVIQPSHSVCIDGAPSNLWASASGFVSTNAVISNNTALCSWIWADQ